MTSIAQAALVMLKNMEFQMQNTLDVKMDKTILLAPFKRDGGVTT